MNKTQCPHCYTIYVISDEQFRTSRGMVRCGTCRERFQAQLLTAETAPKYDADSTFIEPLSEPDETTKISADDFISAEPDIAFQDPNQNISADATEVNSNNLPRATGFSAVDFEFGDSLNSELSIEISDESKQVIDPLEMARVEQAIKQELNIADSVESTISELAAENHISEDKLIDEVDSLIDDKLLGSFDSEESDTSLEDELFQDTQEQSFSEGESFTEDDSFAQDERLETEIEDLAVDADSINASTSSDLDDNIEATSVAENLEPSAAALVQEGPAKHDLDDVFAPKKSSSSKIVRFVGSTLLMLIGLSLVAVLLYQMWLKQRLPWAETEVVQSTLKPVQEKLSTYDIEIPIRRNLSKLELLSARAEEHQTRASTLLLRVSLINRAEISQPLPWLELSLTDTDGRLISRRKLSPADYIFNNRTNQQIGPKQLKKVTIELLAFPEQATGYELRLLNK